MVEGGYLRAPAAPVDAGWSDPALGVDASAVAVVPRRHRPGGTFLGREAR